MALSISALFIVQILSAAIGVSLVQSFVDGEPNRTTLTIGALLMMFSGLVIAAIGVLLYQVLKLTNNRLAVWVPAIRSIECVVALAFGIYLLTNSQPVPNHLLWVYILAGAAGVILSYSLFTSKLVPWPILALGFAGYALLLLGVPLDFGGLIDMNEGLGQALIIPGALFELIALPVWLIAKGFKLLPSAKVSPSPVLVTAS
ncbi:MAG TPA: DUF4386 family protein [Microlunatus sp.]